jgi:DNA-binding MarR family transcriptional regulator
VRGIASAKFDINVQQFHILRQIRRGICSASELASANQISRPAISQAIDALVEKGLVTRRQSAQDRRYVVLELTPSGADVLDAIFQENHGWMAQKLATLSPEELDHITPGLAALRKAFVT